MTARILVKDDSSTWPSIDSVIRADAEKRAWDMGAGPDGNCFVCGRPVHQCRTWIEHTTSGLLIPAGVAVPMESEGYYQGHESQGCFPVGPECAKKPHVAPFVKELGG